MIPEFKQVAPGTAAYNTNYKQFSPSLGFAWKIPATAGPVLSWIDGKEGHSVFRSGYSIATVREGMDYFISIWGANQGRNISLTVNPESFPAEFGPAGSVWFRDASLPTRAEPVQPTYPIAVNAGNSVNDFDPNLKMGYVQSWNVSLQRELSKSTVLDLRYVGNHAVGLWRQVNLNEVNIFENGFLKEFQAAQNNLAIAQRTNPNSTNFGNHGLAGQAPCRSSTAAGISTNDTTFATNLMRGQAGTFANCHRHQRVAHDQYAQRRISGELLHGESHRGQRGRLPGHQRRRVHLQRAAGRSAAAHGQRPPGAGQLCLVEVDHQHAGVLDRGFQPADHLPLRLNDKGPSPWDIRHGFKLNYVYELPVGPRQTLPRACPRHRRRRRSKAGR